VAALITAISPHNGVPVTCSVGYWRDHVELHHPNMVGQAKLVEKVINEPLAIYQSPTDINRHLLYGVSVLPPPFNRGYIRVVVEYTVIVYLTLG
jgi:hypothetical protein